MILQYVPILIVLIVVFMIANRVNAFGTRVRRFMNFDNGAEENDLVLENHGILGYTAENSLVPFFNRSGYDRVTLIHCAALITVASKLNPHVWNINVQGTENVMRQAYAAGVDSKCG